MKGFKNVFAAGALGIILAVTGCAQYNTPVTDTTNPVNTGTTRTRVATDIYGNRFTNRTARNISAKRNIANTTRTTASRNTGRTFTGTNVGRVTRTAPSGNQYQSNIGTQGRARTSGTAGMSGLSAGLPNADMYRRDYAYNTGNITQYPARTLNNTGSPFGDYNKDRAYSLTRGSAGVNNINQQASQTSRNTTGTQNIGGVGSQTVRKSFQAGTARNASDNTGANTRISNNTGTAHKSAAVRSTNAAHKLSANKSNVTRNTAATHTANKSHNTVNRSAGTRAAKNTTAHTVNRTANNAGTNAANVTRSTGSSLAKNTAASGAVTANNTNNAAANNAANLPRTGITGSTVARNTGTDLTAPRNTNSTYSGVRSNRINRSSRSNRSSSGGQVDNRLNMKNQSRSRNGKITQTVYEITDAFGNTRTASNILAERDSKTAILLNSDTVDRLNSRSSYRSVNRGTRNSSRYGYNDDFLRGNSYDNLTYGNTYRNADLRNSSLPSDMPYEVYGTLPYSGMGRGYNEGVYNYYGYYNPNYSRSYPGYTRGANRSSSSRSNRTRTNRTAINTRTTTGSTRTARGHNIAR